MVSPNVPVQYVAGADKSEPERSEGSPAPAMWVSGMSEASVANPDEGAELGEATEERQLGVRR